MTKDEILSRLLSDISVEFGKMSAHRILGLYSVPRVGLFAH